MALLILGLLLLAAKMADFGPVGAWSWWVILAPFAGASLWWAISDKLGLTQRRAMKRMQDRKDQRRAAALKSLGIDPKRPRSLVREVPQDGFGTRAPSSSPSHDPFDMDRDAGGSTGSPARPSADPTRRDPLP